MEALTIIAAHAIAFTVLAGLVLPLLAARLLLALDEHQSRLALPSMLKATPRQAVLPRRLRFGRLQTLAEQYGATPHAGSGQATRVAPGLASRWKGAHRLAISA